MGDPGMNNRIERDSEPNGGRFNIPAPIVYGVIVGLVLAAIGGGSTGLIAALKFNQALNKVNALPSAQMLMARRQTQRAIDARQNERIDRLEQKVFGMAPFQPGDLLCIPNQPCSGRSTPHRVSIPRIASLRQK